MWDIVIILFAIPHQQLSVLRDVSDGLVVDLFSVLEGQEILLFFTTGTVDITHPVRLRFVLTINVVQSSLSPVDLPRVSIESKN